MADENGLHENISSNQAASTSNSMMITDISGETHNQQDSEKSKGEYDSKNTVPFYKLFVFADSTDVMLMIVGTVAAAANGVAIPLMTILFGQLMDSFGQTPDPHEIVDKISKVSLRFVYLGLGSGLASFFQVVSWMVTGERQAARIRNLYLKTILRQDIAFFDKETNTGEVIGRMSGDTVRIQEAMGEKVGKFIQLISTFIGGFVVSFSKGWLLTFVMLSSIPPLVITGAVMAVRIEKMASRGQTAYAEAGVIVEQTIGSIRTVASFTGEKKAVHKYGKSLNTAYKSGVQEGFISGLGLGSVMFVLLCSYALTIWFGSRLILNNEYTGGVVVTVMLGVINGSMSLGQASPLLSAFGAGQAAAFKMFETIKRKPEIDAYDLSGLKLDDIKGDIELRDVYFSYPARPEEQIFTGFSIFIPSGMSVALVGESGSGKSTMLFTSSIRENIAYGKEGATLEQVRAAAELANAAKFIDKMPQGLETMVGEHGIQLSGGQKQRIAIARAILKDPRILLLDEATSALDAESERIVQEALDRIKVDRTTAIVAHRLSTVRNADMVAVIHRGSIIEKGSHSELVKIPNGAYCQLIHLQEMKKESDLTTTDPEKLDISMDSGKQSSRQLSLHKSISQGSSGSAGNSSRHSFSVSFGVHSGLHVQEVPSLETDAPPQPQNPPKVPLRRLAYLNKPEIPVLLLGTIAASINGVIMPPFGIFISSVIKAFYESPSKLQKDSRFWSLIYVAVALVALVLSPAQTYFFSVAGCRLIRRIRLMSFEKVVNMEIGWFDNAENSSGAIGARLSADAATVRGLVGDSLALLAQNTASLVAGLAIAFEACWQLAFLILAMVTLIGFIGWVQLKFVRGFSANAKMMYEEASQVANDAVGSIRTVASFCAEDKVMELYKKKCEASFYAGARLVENGKTTFTEVFRVFFALTMAAFAVSQSSSFTPDAAKAKTSTASIFGILDRKSRIDQNDDSGITLENVKGNIEFLHVSFKYPTRPDVEIFQDLCLFVQSGKTIALVGESGCGKSTAISLLQRFYDPDSGQIILDGVEIQKLQLRWLRQQMGLVSQEPVLFNDTIRANISYGKEGGATEAEILAAAEFANAHKFISSLQQGYDTLVGERGVQLSGGQKQRVAIARAIVKEPKILLLDEATSALDAESEHVVQEALDRVMVNRTTIVVAHRLSTIKGADLIAVVKNGVIVEKGKHEALINVRDGVYASLVALHMSASS
ncbi:hypothetical protein MRB53_025800 [Persea americana]|uniref:Uncharacterized protein n=1 Tax=Persea americana TaxID=3435 RepID=A0ACC2LGB7_PERAE|nr:hypothetical protein MRB53_025800 [Persea americana]